MIWPVVLVGLPVLAVTFMVTGSMLDRENLGYWLTLYSRLMLFTVLLFMLFNFVFSLYSAAMVFRYRSFFQGVLALLAAVFSMGLASYFFGSILALSGGTYFQPERQIVRRFIFPDFLCVNGDSGSVVFFRYWC